MALLQGKAMLPVLRGPSEGKSCPLSEILFVHLQTEVF